MTTIASDGRVMAGDSLITAGQERVGYHAKVRRAKDGRIFGIAGCCADGEAFSRWMDDPTEDGKPILSDDFEALILDHDGAVYHVTSKLEPICYSAPVSIGSGSHIALGAMLSGKSPAEAVEIAKMRDIRTAGDVVELKP